ncbi:hypothetical protein BDV24DRAFT_148447 [Aspergillus arachidicola]|uniref:Short-chain dehydrogenase n=1 Tax=Aspergillus arachidicola TaxID=656916 RepID=A0A5N6YJA7_9EURO|nr:hypothetical protein BDV24DRAFT_148447 [Aspergillus arachidicola]
MKRVWFITGCSRGLGLDIAEAALNAGDSIIATARRPEQLAGPTEKYGGGRVFTLALDVSNNDQVIKVVKAGHERFGRIDIVDIDIDDFRAQVDTNLFGQGSGHIFQISSVGGGLGVPVEGFSTVLAREVAPLGINVTVVEPDGMKTDWPGLSMRIPPVSKPYESTEPSIPTKVASINIGLSNEEDPPLRLLIGPDAVEHALSQHLTQSVECFFSLVQPPPVAFR